MSIKEALDDFLDLYYEKLTTESFRITDPIQQDWNKINSNLHQYYISYRAGDTDQCTVCINRVLAILNDYDLVVDELPVDIINSGGGSGILPVSHTLHWDGTNHWYEPYSTQQASLSFDISTTNPTLTDRLNVNGYFYATKVTSVTTFSNVSGNYNPIDITAGGASYRSIINGYSGSLEVNRPGSSQTGTLTAPILYVKNTPNGTANITSPVLSIQDNPTCSGTLVYPSINIEIDSTDRVVVYPRVADSAGNKAYLWDTDTTLSSANHTDYKNAGTTIKTLKSDGSEESLLGKYIYWRQTIGSDTNGDVRMVADANGWYVERREGGTWVSKFDITF